MKTKEEWNTIKKEYTHGIVLRNGGRHLPTLKGLSERHNTSLNTIKAQSRRNYWSQKREEARMKREGDVFVENRLQNCECA